jgi:hypothetical protein
VAARWFGKQVDQAVGRRLAGSVHDAGELYAKLLPERLAVEDRPPSSPGESAHRETGELIDSIEVNVDAKNLK